MDNLFLDNKIAEKKICAFLKKAFRERGKTRAVLGISGGIDSVISAFLCEKAGLDLYFVSLPYGKLSKNKEIQIIVKQLNLKRNKFIKIDITDMIDKQFAEINKKIVLDKIDKGNLMARTRMAILYAIAKKLNGLVIGTENLSEYWLGYFTLYGDQASDINPIANLWKTQVWQLAEYLGVPVEVLKQKPSADLWKGQTDEKDLGFSYKQADPILYLSCVKKYSKTKIIKEYKFDSGLVEKVLKRVKDTNFKRQKI